MKKKIVSVFLVVALIAVTAAGTLAYFTDKDEKDNVFTVGNVDIVLTEEQWDAAGKTDAPEVYPNEALAKDPVVTNNGKNPCFVRIKVTGLDSLAPAGLITYETANVSGALGEGWKEYNGYFYYEDVLSVDEETTALFDHIRMPKDLTNGYTGEYHVVVTAEAVQAQGARPSFSAVEAMKAADIAAWFTTCQNG